MGMRFRKSFKLAPGVKVNLGKKSMGVSFGNKYGGISVNSKTGIRSRASIPGTGISFSNTSSIGKRKEIAPIARQSEALSSLQFLIFSLIISIAGLALVFFNYIVPGIAAFGIGLVLLLISYFSQ